jgi:uncharacterized protein (DUF362 family)
MGKVSVVRTGSDVEASVRRSVELIGGINLKGAKTVLVKPNICNAKNTDGMILTDFRIIEAVIKIIREKGSEPLVVESDNIADSADRRVEESGLKAKLEEWGVEFMNVSRDECVPHLVAGTEIMIPRTVLEAEYLVNLPKIKTCAHTLVTLSIKNLFGLFQEAKKSRLHKKLDEVLPFLAKTIRSDLIVVDGMICMEGNGPIVGSPRYLGVIVAGTNVVEVDSFCLGLIGFKAEEVSHIANTAALGVGELSGYEVIGDPWEVLCCKFERPYSLRASLRSLRTIGDIYLKR